ncbi:MAG: 50S ribosomal protein L21 [Candidatus Gottesmanbacteria bacterium]
MFAVVEISGKQYIATPGETIIVDRIDGKDGETVTFDRVFLVSDEKKVTVGTPVVKGAKVTVKITKQGKGEKLEVRRYKHKVRYRKHIGFRAHETKLEIVSIG